MFYLYLNFFFSLIIILLPVGEALVIVRKKHCGQVMGYMGRERLVFFLHPAYLCASRGYLQFRSLHLLFIISQFCVQAFTGRTDCSCSTTKKKKNYSRFEAMMNRYRYTLSAIKLTDRNLTKAKCKATLFNTFFTLVKKLTEKLQLHRYNPSKSL